VARQRKPWTEINNETDPVRTRFVIDVLSGTSAGGINAIFLAKALANNQSIEQLKQLWIEEGDITQLLNDSQSVNLLSQIPRSKLRGISLTFPYRDFSQYGC
jgi:predicted acylesterase/phospholipase RssA